MHINVRYKPDLKEAVRLNLYLARKTLWICLVGGVFVLIAGSAASPAAAGVLYVLGVAVILQPLVRVLVWVYRNRQILQQDVELTLTPAGIQRRTDDYALRVTWDMVERAEELKSRWIFFTKGRVRVIALRKERLSREQQAELAAFVESRHLSQQVRKGMTPAQEAGYALDYGVGRADLKPEVQAEYDRLLAERGSA
jgi:hypothetical protein